MLHILKPTRFHLVDQKCSKLVLHSAIYRAISKGAGVSDGGNHLLGLPEINRTLIIIYPTFRYVN